MTQKEAVFNAVTSVISENNISVTEGTDVSTVMTRELRSQVNAILFEGIRNGTITVESQFSDADLKAYISGLQSNWLRKDKRLNGGVSYLAKNPGSRVGSSDPSLKAMRSLLSTLTSESDKAEVQAAIDLRVNEIHATKVKKVVIDTNSLPESLRFLIK
jgi:hypothetical protein